MEMYSVKLGISLDEKSVAKIKTDIQSKLKNEKIDIKVDAKSFDEVEKKVDKINTKLSKTSKQDGFSKTDKTAKTAPPVANDPSTVKSAKSRILNVIKTPMAAMP